MPRLDIPVDDRTAAAVRFAADRRGQSVAEFARRAVSVQVGAEAGPYRFTGLQGHSFIRDLAAVQGWATGESVEVDQAKERLRRFEVWSEDHPLLFAPITTSGAAAVVPTGYKPAIEIAMTGDRPLANACVNAPISNAAPFNVPSTQSTASTIDASRVEGSQPADGALTFNSEAVTPVGLSGKVVLTRELVDSAAPGGDLIALQVMREEWYRQVETRIYNMLNGSEGQGGTITTGFVPSGAQARVSTTPATNLLIDLRKAVLEYANVRRRKARKVVAGAAALTNLGGLLGAEASSGDDTMLANIFGARLNAAVNDYGTASTDMRVTILGSDDVVNFESPLAVFRFDEQAGPALVTAAVWGYHAIAVARPRGLSSIRFA